MMADLDLHFGAGLALGVGETARQARWMEELGYDYISAGEHFVRGDPPGPTPAALPVLAVAAGATDQLPILPSRNLPPFSHPLVLARPPAPPAGPPSPTRVTGPAARPRADRSRSPFGRRRSSRSTALACASG